MKKSLAFIALTSLPLLASAGAPNTGPGTLGAYIVEMGRFVNSYIIPLLLALAFLFFIWNMTRFFIIGSVNGEEHQRSRSLALWGILAFVIIASIWGITNVLVDALNLSNIGAVCPDYNPNCKQ